LVKKKQLAPPGFMMKNVRKCNLFNKIQNLFVVTHQTNMIPSDWLKGNIVYLAKIDNGFLGEIH
jgi:hypothetical protein